MKITELQKILTNVKKDAGDIEIGIKILYNGIILTKDIESITHNKFEGCNITNEED